MLRTADFGLRIRETSRISPRAGGSANAVYLVESASPTNAPLNINHAFGWGPLHRKWPSAQKASVVEQGKVSNKTASTNAQAKSKTAASAHTAAAGKTR